MIMESMGRWKLFWSDKIKFVVGDDRLEVEMKKRFLNNMNGVELGNNSKKNFFENIFDAMEPDDLRGTCCDALELICCPSCWNCMIKTLKSMRMGPRVHNHSTLRKMSQPPMYIENIWDFR
jgi:hypothetical protein